ncbi:Peptidyl-prolyl cis-trans isomerase FKBP19-chloroplastic [Striga hermonthica]|uniref:peptidylprolyl isomerase n=1 Tax=Striga hermonthica TaxID=68872 RepID=A0A9N7MXR1_STRHE|nr:Peptidyl-prolyl cis-trans isomerase FKBP19-chloroplastic [Striga hermonthica]
MATISAVGSLPKHFPAKFPTAGPPSSPLFLNLNISCRCSFESSSSFEPKGFSERRPPIGRREVVMSSIGLMAAANFDAPRGEVSTASEYADMPALRGKDYGKSKMRYPDYTETISGLQYKDLRMGNGPTPKIGETVVVDWDGYTIGYYGRIFEARNKTKGGSFEGDDKDFYKFRLGSQEVIPAFEEAVSGMALGGIRRIIVPPELGYPENDFNRKGPRPTTFSGQRALDFVLRNQGLIDKTLLFDIELLKIVPNGRS